MDINKMSEEIQLPTITQRRFNTIIRQIEESNSLAEALVILSQNINLLEVRTPGDGSRSRADRIAWSVLGVLRDAVESIKLNDSVEEFEPEDLGDAGTDVPVQTGSGNHYSSRAADIAWSKTLEKESK